MRGELLQPRGGRAKPPDSLAEPQTHPQQEPSQGAFPGDSDTQQGHRALLGQALHSRSRRRPNLAVHSMSAYKGLWSQGLWAGVLTTSAGHGLAKPNEMAAWRRRQLQPRSHQLISEEEGVRVRTHGPSKSLSGLQRKPSNLCWTRGPCT